MASERELIVMKAPYSTNFIVAYEGTTGQVPFDLAGEYTRESIAKEAILKFKISREAEKQLKTVPSSGEVSGNTKSK